MYNSKILLVRLRNCYVHECDWENLYVFNLGSQTCLRCSDLEKKLEKLTKDKENYEKDIKHLQEANKKGKKDFVQESAGKPAFFWPPYFWV